MGLNVFSLLEDAASKFRRHPAIIENGKEISFDELYISARKLGSVIKEAGLSGMGMMLICRNSSRFVSALFACANAGSIAMPVLNGTGENEVEKLLNDSAIHALLAEKENRFS